MRIKVIEDEIDIAILYKLTLQLEGHDIDIFTGNFKDTLNISEWLEVDVAILDLMLPDCSGIDILVFLKKNCPWVKVVVVTAALGLLNDTLLESADRVLSKPFRPLDLLVAINSNIRESSEGATILRRTIHKYVWEGSMDKWQDSQKRKIIN